MRKNCTCMLYAWNNWAVTEDIFIFAVSLLFTLRIRGLLRAYELYKFTFAWRWHWQSVSNVNFSRCDRTACMHCDRLLAWQCCLSVCPSVCLPVMLCIVVKQYIGLPPVLQQKCLNKWIGTRKCTRRNMILQLSSFNPLHRPWAIKNYAG